MPRGSNIKKGQRPGGRKKGTPNRATVQKVEEARVAVEQSKGRGVKLGKEVLEDFMMQFASMAAVHQPMDNTVMPKGKTPNATKFLTFAKLTVDTAKALADFQSPKFKAIMVQSTGDQSQKPTAHQDGNIITLDDPIALARVYQNRIKAVR